MVLNIGHSTRPHGVLRLRLTLDGERIVDCEPIIGYMPPRCREAVRGPRLPSDRRAGESARLALGLRQRELGVVMAAEPMLGMEVPVRAIWADT